MKKRRKYTDPTRKFPAGRQTKYNPDEHPAAVRLLVGNGKTLQDVTEALGIARATLTSWQALHPELSAAIQLGREDANTRVERALFERATGYEHPSEKIVVVSNGPEGGSSVERVPIKVHYPPDAASMQFWLKNRMPKEWRDKSELEVKVNIAEVIAEGRKRVRELREQNNKKEGES